MENIATEPVPPSLKEEFLNSVLPPGWGTNIVGKRIVEGEDTFPSVELIFFIKCTNKEEFAKWLIEFENITNASYIISSTDIEDGARVKFKRRLRCHHSTRCPNTYDPSLKNKTRNTNCPSKLTVKIHVIRKKYRGKQEKFQLLQETPCEIKLILTHNHSTADSLRFRKVANNVKEELLSLYQNGHTAGTALEIIKSNIQQTRDDYVMALADRNICPSYKYCYDLYMKEFKTNYGPVKLDMEEKVLPFIKNTNSTGESSTASLNQVREDNSPSFSEDTYLSTSIPTDSNVVHLPSLKHEEIKKTYTKLLANINHIFNKFFVKSPLEVTSSMEKMMSTLESIKTLADFSSAIATFGHGAGGRRTGRIIPIKKTVVGLRIKKQNKRTKNHLLHTTVKKNENI